MTTEELAGKAHRSASSVRLAGCLNCGHRGRALRERDGLLAARCLGCGEEFPIPLATVEVSESSLVGRGGQRIIDLVISDAA